MSDTEFHYPHALVNTDWLAAHLEDTDLRIFDCTTYLVVKEGGTGPYDVVSGRADFDAGHIPGSGFLNLQKDFSVADSPYRFTLPPLNILADAFAAHGIGDNAQVVLYSRGGMVWATRFWWMLRAIGFDNAAILDGGFDKWTAEGRPASTEECGYGPKTLSLNPRPGLFIGKDTVLAALGNKGICTLNALSFDLHSGSDARYGRPGRIPGSVNLPAASLIESETKQLIGPKAAAQAVRKAGIENDQPVIAYCGGGIAASLDAFILYQLGWDDIAIYDNSMSEWANDPSLPMETD